MLCIFDHNKSVLFPFDTLLVLTVVSVEVFPVFAFFSLAHSCIAFKLPRFYLNIYKEVYI